LPTLYELLGALPEDDADGLREAFRKAAKASHPDNNPDDSDAPQRFRQLVRAHDILKDEGQRATYDWLLAVAQQERTLDSRRKALAEFNLPGPIGCMVIASVSIGAFLLIDRALTIAPAPARLHDVSVRASALTAAMPAPAPDTVGMASERDKRDETSPVKEPEIREPPIPAVAEKVTVTAPVVVATAADNDDAIPKNSEPNISEPKISEPKISELKISEPKTSELKISEPELPEPVVKDAQYYLERGSLAYRSGDLPLALIDFDVAIGLDPNSSDAYVNRAIVFRRMGDVKRAFADVNEARRIDEGKRK
jgi:tetratricopeptide (TPR) repeat protein